MMIITYRLNFCFILFCSIFLLFACEEEFDPEITKYENILVVEGGITDIEGAHTVILSRSYAYDAAKGENISNAIVTIESDFGEIETLKYVGDGKYATCDTFCAKVGVAYKLKMNINSKNYESQYQIMPEKVEVDSFFWEKDEKIIEDKNEVVLQTYINAHNIDNKTLYCKWEFEEEYEFSVWYAIGRYDNMRICWRKNKLKDFFVGTSQGQNISAIKKQKLLTFDRHTQKMFIRYSVNCKQYSITEDVYNYYVNMKKQDDSQGSLFEKTPMSLQSNIACLSDENEPVLGIFQVSSVSEKRLYIDNKELPKGFVLDAFVTDCEMTSIGINQYYEKINLESEGWRFAEYNVGPSGDTSLVYFNSQACFDCTANGDPNIFPDYWESY